MFTAYYETSPHFEISAGAIGSLLGGRQLATVSLPYSPVGTMGEVNNCSTAVNVQGMLPQACLGLKAQSAYQFMPALFVEYHWNGRCPWAINGGPWHPLGYVCSLGPAGGLAVNPNNGSTAAEFFEGISFGIQRVALFAGFHNGRVQDFGEGYYVGEIVPAGTSAPTFLRCQTHPAFGISYRIPLR